jgi:hypothetical protein
MQIPGELIGLVAVVLGGLSILIPIAGLTARIAMKPIVESLARYREARGGDENSILLERRMGLIEQQLDGMERSLRLLVEDADFRRGLESGTPLRALGPPAEPLA